MHHLSRHILRQIAILAMQYDLFVISSLLFDYLLISLLYLLIRHLWSGVATNVFDELLVLCAI